MMRRVSICRVPSSRFFPPGPQFDEANGLGTRLTFLRMVSSIGVFEVLAILIVEYKLRRIKALAAT